jgi:hypothetical protein
MGGGGRARKWQEVEGNVSDAVLEDWSDHQPDDEETDWGAASGALESSNLIVKEGGETCRAKYSEVMQYYTPHWCLAADGVGCNSGGLLPVGFSSQNMQVLVLRSAVLHV